MICYHENTYRTLINFVIIDGSLRGADCALDFIVTEEDIRVARKRLPYVVENLKF